MAQLQMNKVLICSGFHRSASSATARYLSESGLPMGLHMMAGNISNVGGHYEDWLTVKLHDRLLADADTNWQFHDEVPLNISSNQDFINYVQLRDQQHSDWGMKDPRALLFLEQWHQTLGDRGRYLFLIRHWSSSIESLLYRHSRDLAHGMKNFQQGKGDLNFWMKPDLAARMWLEYNQRLLNFVQQYPDQCLVVTQRALFDKNPLIETLNTRFGFDLNSGGEPPFDSALLRDYASSRVPSVLSESLRHRLNDLWQKLLDSACFRVDDETPVWVEDELTVAKDYYDQLNSARKAIPINSIQNQASVESIDDFLIKLDSAESIDEVKKLLVETRTANRFRELEDAQRLMLWIDQHYKTAANIYLELALWLQARQFWREALVSFQWTMSLGLVYPYIYMNIGQCYEAINEMDLSLYFLNKAIEKNPNNPGFWIVKGHFLRNTGKLDESIDFYSKAVELAPNNHGCVLPYCDILEQKGRLDEACSLALKHLEANPNNLELQNMVVRLTLRINKEKGTGLYLNMVKQRITEENKIEWLADIIDNVGVKPAETDFILRVEGHWKLIK